MTSDTCSNDLWSEILRLVYQESYFSSVIIKEQIYYPRKTKWLDILCERGEHDPYLVCDGYMHCECPPKQCKDHIDYNISYSPLLNEVRFRMNLDGNPKLEIIQDFPAKR